MAVLSTHIFIDFFSVNMLMASYAALAATLLVFVGAMWLLLRDQRLTRFNMVVLLFVLLILGVSLMSGTDWKNWLYTALSILTYLVLFYYYQDQYKTLVIAALVVLSLGVYAQLLQCLRHPEMWMLIDGTKAIRGYLLGGNYNQIGSRVLLAFTLGMMSVRYSKWWYLNLIPLLIAGLTVLALVKSMTSLSCIILFLLLCLSRKPRLMKVGLIGLYSGWLLFQCVVCFQGIGLANNEFASWFVEDVLGKDMTFTGRTHMWDSALRVIAESPIWGYGLVDTEWFYSNMSTQAIGAHNFILNTMVYGGVLSMFLYGGMIALSIHHLRTFRDCDSRRLIAAFGILSVMMLFEAYNIAVVFFLLSLMYYYCPNDAIDQK